MPPKIAIKRLKKTEPKKTSNEGSLWKAQAKATATRWASFKNPGCELEYLAEKGYWQAVNLGGFEGTLEDWFKVVRSCLPR
jgi:hypothetical protein